MAMADTVRMLYNSVKEKFKFELKDEQVNIISALLGNRDVTALLPTGYGKSIHSKESFELPHVSVVVSPLISLMKDQQQQLHSWGIKSAISSDEQINVKDIASADVSVIFVTPEALIRNQWRDLLLDSKFQKRLCLLACDEAHCVSEWGENFRPEFRQISTVRSLCDVPLLAITATATDKVRADIIRYLDVKDDAYAIGIIPDRPNITLCVKERCSHDEQQELAWLLEKVKAEDDPRTMCKTVIFCRSYLMVFRVWSWLHKSLGFQTYAGEEQENHSLVEMFTSSSPEKTKDRILAVFSSPDSSIRILVSTVAFGMGVDIRDIKLVLHWGAPRSFLSYWQEVGRAGRDGNEAFAVMYPYRRSMMSSVCDKDFAASIAVDQCLREKTLIALTTCDMKKEDIPQRINCKDNNCIICECDLCRCCSVCFSRCSCSGKLDVIAKMCILKSSV
ncbi:RECQ-like protein [Mya arenaria]|uniref:DNA 3'-5' helicase n=1 Tax=Mya arenaria TaxID=6604 RepID=A0ABY7GCM8_MYAAR|nr:RECQ-like protein [Mya arenaria]